MQKVLLYGNSLFLGVLQASLEAVADLDVRYIETIPDLLQQELVNDPPSVLIMELGAASGDFCLELLQEFPRLTLIGVSLESEQLLVMSVKQQTALATKDLVNVIQTANHE